MLLQSLQEEPRCTSNRSAANCCMTPLKTKLTSPMAQTTTPKAMSAILEALALENCSVPIKIPVA